LQEINSVEFDAVMRLSGDDMPAMMPEQKEKEADRLDG